MGTKTSKQFVLKAFFFGFIAVMLFVGALPFLSFLFDTILYEGYPFSSIVLVALVIISSEATVLGFAILAKYILIQSGLLLFVSLGVFKCRKCMVPFSVILSINIIPALLMGDFLGIIATLLYIITGNVLAQQMEQYRLEQRSRLMIRRDH